MKDLQCFANILKKNQFDYVISALFCQKSLLTCQIFMSIVLSDDYVDLSDIYVILPDLYVDLSDLYVVFSDLYVYLSEKNVDLSFIREKINL